MTTKEIAKIANKKERAVHNWLNKLSAKNTEVCAKIAEAKNTKKPADYDFHEVYEILIIGLGKNAAGLFKENYENQNKIKFSPESLENRIDRMEKIMENLILIVGEIAKKQVLPPSQRPILPPAVMISNRDAIRQIVAKAAKREGGDYPKIWDVLYSECYYRLHKNYKVTAKNAGMNVLEYIETCGDALKVLSIARELFEAPGAEI